MKRREFITSTGLALLVTTTPLGLLATPQKELTAKEFWEFGTRGWETYDLYTYSSGEGKFTISAELPVDMSDEEKFKVLEELAAEQGIEPYCSWQKGKQT
jgi:hypothetical protein